MVELMGFANKLSTQQINNIVDLIDGGKTFREVGDMYKVDPNTIKYHYKRLTGKKPLNRKYKKTKSIQIPLIGSTDDKVMVVITTASNLKSIIGAL